MLFDLKDLQSPSVSQTIKGSLIVALVYNSSVGFFGKKTNPFEVVNFLQFKVAPRKGIDPATLIMIAKAVCKAAEFVCPMIDNL